VRGVWSLLVLVVVLTGCQVRAQVAIDVETDGTGSVLVAVSLDEAALARLGDPSTALRIDDLTQAGWTVTGPKVLDDGFSQWTAAKPFLSIDDLNQVLAEVVGPDGPIRDLALAVTDDDAATVSRLTGTVDLSAGIDAFADPDLALALDGDPFGGQIAAVEADEGRPVADMFEIVVTASIGDEGQVLPVRLGDPAVAIDVTETVNKPQSQWLWLGIGIVVVGGLVVALIAARRRFVDPHL